MKKVKGFPDFITPGKIILYFLHLWLTQGIPNKLEDKSNFRIGKMRDELNELSDQKLACFGLDRSISKIVENCFKALEKVEMSPRESKRRVSLTTTGIVKTLHILMSDFLIM